MAKQTGLGDNFYGGGNDLTGDVASIETIGGGPEALNITDISQSGFDRAGGKRSGGISWTAWFNTAAEKTHAGRSALPTTDVQVMYFRGTTVGNAAAAVVAKQINYDPTRNADGTLQFNIDAESNAFGLEWGTMLTAGVKTDSGAANGTGDDSGAGSTSFGLQAYLQAFDFTGTDVTVKLQESQNDGSPDSYADVTGGGFTQITTDGPKQERIATATNLTVERWIRAITITTGGFSDFDFAVMFVRNATVPVF